MISKINQKLSIYNIPNIGDLFSNDETEI